MENINRNVATAIFETVENPEKWYRALELLCKECGASKAIIALRHAETAEFVIPSGVQDEHNSPMLYGFSEEEVGSFICHYIKHDIWTEYERVYRPHIPYALSKHIPLQELTNSTFWEWLEPQEINDTIVAELGYTNGFWAAINLYFQNSDGQISRVIEVNLNKYLPILQQAWQIGRNLTVARLESQNQPQLICHLPHTAIVVDHHFIVLSRNNKAQELEEIGLIENLSIGTKLRLASEIPIQSSALTSEQLKILSSGQKISTDEKTPCKYAATIVPVSETEDILGEVHSGYLVTIMPTNALHLEGESPVWENDTLSAKERILVRMVAEGKQIVEVEKLLGISKSRSMQIWRSARKKLEIKDKAEVFSIHQVFLSKNYT